MKKIWYRSKACKGILIFLESVLGSLVIMGLIWMIFFLYHGWLNEVIVREDEQNIFKSQIFGDALIDMTDQILRSETSDLSKILSNDTPGETVVDIKTFVEKSLFTAKGSDCLEYTVADLKEWCQNWHSSYGGTDASIVVCYNSATEKYTYFKASEFEEKMLEDHELSFDAKVKAAARDYYDAVLDDGEILSHLFEEEKDFVEYYEMGIVDADGKEIFNNCWVYTGLQIEEKYRPVGYESVLEFMNKEPKWNGHLGEVMGYLESTLNTFNFQLMNMEDTSDTYKEGNTNLSYWIHDLNSNKIYTNVHYYSNASQGEECREKMMEKEVYCLVTDSLKDFSASVKLEPISMINVIKTGLGSSHFEAAFSVDTELPIRDALAIAARDYEHMIHSGRMWIGVGCVSFVLFVIGLFWISLLAGRDEETGEVHPAIYDGGWTEIYLGILIAAGGFVFLGILTAYGIAYNYVDRWASEFYLRTIGMGILAEMSWVERWRFDSILLLIVCGIAATGILLLLWIGLVRRWKAKLLWKNSIFRRVVLLVESIWNNIPILWSTLLILLAAALVHIVTYFKGAFNIWIVLFALMMDLAIAIWIITRSVGWGTIQKGVEIITSGELNYQIESEKLSGQQRQLANSINKIGEGLDHAVEKSIREERTKTELITNVSHDIKTPLTSIISYIDLMKRENIENQNVKKYLEILEEKAYRLKTLTEDVVEASKVSSGNIKLEKTNLNFVELVNQTIVELEEKFENKNLELRVNLPGEPLIVNADGRRMWRVLANLFNNAAKYSLGGTRVYVDLRRDGKNAVFTMKNISENALSVASNELTERFVRGDSSRATEGSGLGLSIAKSLIQLMGGTFEIVLDGDLFKVEFSLPICE